MKSKLPTLYNVQAATDLTDPQLNTQTDRQANGQAGRHTLRQEYRRQLNRQKPNRQAYRWTDYRTTSK